MIPVEAKKFLEEETANEVMNNTTTTGDQDDNEEDLVSEIDRLFWKERSTVSLILVRSHLKIDSTGFSFNVRLENFIFLYIKSRFCDVLLFD